MFIANLSFVTCYSVTKLHNGILSSADTDCLQISAWPTCGHGWNWPAITLIVWPPYRRKITFTNKFRKCCWFLFVFREEGVQQWFSCILLPGPFCCALAVRKMLRTLRAIREAHTRIRCMIIVRVVARRGPTYVILITLSRNLKVSLLFVVFKL